MSKSVYYYNDLYGDSIRLEDLSRWELPIRDRWEAIWKIPHFFTDLPWMDEKAKGVLTRWKEQEHEVVIVTSPPSFASYESKAQWVHTNLKIPGFIDSMDQLVMTRRKHYVEGDIIIDDKASNVRDHRASGIIYGRPWNREVKYNRALDWGDVEWMVKLLQRDPPQYVLNTDYYKEIS